jgi:hypothetical protein
MLSVAAVLARAITEAGVDHDGIPREDTAYPCSNGFDDSRPVRADDPGRHEGDPWQPFDEPQVEMVERRRSDADQDVRRPMKLRLGKVRPKRDLFEAAVRGKRECSQTVASAR